MWSPTAEPGDLGEWVFTGVGSGISDQICPNCLANAEKQSNARGGRTMTDTARNAHVAQQDRLAAALLTVLRACEPGLVFTRVAPGETAPDTLPEERTTDADLPERRTP
jgi:hypothetical protein